jgi:hypothetical protein
MRRKDLFWLTVSEVTLCGLWAVVRQNTIAGAPGRRGLITLWWPGSRERERERKGLGQEALQRLAPVASFLQPGSAPSSPSQGQQPQNPITSQLHHQLGTGAFRVTHHIQTVRARAWRN